MNIIDITFLDRKTWEYSKQAKRSPQNENLSQIRNTIRTNLSEAKKTKIFERKTNSEIFPLKVSQIGRGRNGIVDNTKRFKIQVINKSRESINSTFRKSKQEIIQPATKKDIHVDNRVGDDSGAISKKLTLLNVAWAEIFKRYSNNERLVSLFRSKDTAQKSHYNQIHLFPKHCKMGIQVNSVQHKLHFTS